MANLTLAAQGAVARSTGAKPGQAPGRRRYIRSMAVVCDGASPGASASEKRSLVRV